MTVERCWQVYWISIDVLLGEGSDCACHLFGELHGIKTCPNRGDGVIYLSMGQSIYFLWHFKTVCRCCFSLLLPLGLGLIQVGTDTAGKNQ